MQTQTDISKADRLTDQSDGVGNGTLEDVSIVCEGDTGHIPFPHLKVHRLVSPAP